MVLWRPNITNNDALLLACKNNDLLTVKQLLNFTSVDHHRNNDEAMHVAIKNWNFRIALYLHCYKNTYLDYWNYKSISINIMPYFSKHIEYLTLKPKDSECYVLDDDIFYATNP